MFKCYCLQGARAYSTAVARIPSSPFPLFGSRPITEAQVRLAEETLNFPPLLMAGHPCEPISTAIVQPILNVNSGFCHLQCYHKIWSYPVGIICCPFHILCAHNLNSSLQHSIKRMVTLHCLTMETNIHYLILVNGTIFLIWNRKYLLPSDLTL